MNTPGYLALNVYEIGWPGFADRKAVLGSI
jgi:hypothetical protein